LLSDRIAVLEKYQYEGLGKERVTDPIFNKLIEKIDSLVAARSEVAGQSKGINSAIVYIVLGIGLVGTMLGIISFFR
jgi:hypothetical protein